MFLELIELTAATISSGAMGVIGYSIGKKKGKQKTTPDLKEELKEVEEYLNPYDKDNKTQKETPTLSVIDWAFSESKGRHICPKCTTRLHSKDDACRSNICRCKLYETEHFHFYCANCKFKAIMKTADKQKITDKSVLDYHIHKSLV